MVCTKNPPWVIWGQLDVPLRYLALKMAKLAHFQGFYMGKNCFQSFGTEFCPLTLDSGRNPPFLFFQKHLCSYQGSGPQMGGGATPPLGEERRWSLVGRVTIPIYLGNSQGGWPRVLGTPSPLGEEDIPTTCSMMNPKMVEMSNNGQGSTGSPVGVSCSSPYP